MLQTVESKLREIDSLVFYGAVNLPENATLWNYTVFDRQMMRPNDNKTCYSYYFNVHIVREDFIPWGLEVEFINKMLEINGMRLAGSDITYDYTTKPNTNTVIEMATIGFVKALKV